VSEISYSILGDRIVLFHEAIKDHEYLVDLAESTDWWENAGAFNPDDNGGAERHETAIRISNENYRGANTLTTLNNILKTYSSILGSSYYDANPSIMNDTLTMNVSRYSTGGYVRDHRDEDYIEDNGVYTCIIYMNSEFTGGEVGFTEHGVEIKPIAGDVLMFPSYYIHYGLPVMGRKYMSIARYKFFDV
jgi:hypothetical protein